MPPVIRSSQVVAISGTSAQFTNAMTPDALYRFTADTDCWIFVGATGGDATADTADNHLYIKGQTLYLSVDDATTLGFVHAIQESAAGSGTLSLIENV